MLCFYPMFEPSLFNPALRITLTKAFGISAAGMFVLLALGLVIYDFDTTRAFASFFMIILAVLAFDNSDANYGVAAAGVAFLINPFSPFEFQRYIWVLSDVTCIAGIFYYVYRSTNPHQKGIRFEAHVESLFPSDKFILVDRTRDISKFSNRKVESDSNPDFVFRVKDTKNEFAVECKWRASWYTKNGKVGMYWDLKHQESYVKFSQAKSMPVYIAFGIGGRPEQPNEVHFIEVAKTIYPFLWKELIVSGPKVKDIERKV